MLIFDSAAHLCSLLYTLYYVVAQMSHDYCMYIEVQ